MRNVVFRKKVYSKSGKIDKTHIFPIICLCIGRTGYKSHPKTWTPERKKFYNMSHVLIYSASSPRSSVYAHAHVPGRTCIYKSLGGTLLARSSEHWS